MEARSERLVRRRALDGLWERDVGGRADYRERLELELQLYAKHGWLDEVRFFAETSFPCVVSPCSVLAWSLGLSPIDPVRAGVDVFHLEWATTLERCAVKRLPSEGFEELVNGIALERPFPVWSGMADAYHLGLVPKPWPSWGTGTRGLMIYRSQALERLVREEIATREDARRSLVDDPAKVATALGCSLDTIRGLCRREKMEDLAFAHFGTPGPRRISQLRR